MDVVCTDETGTLTSGRLTLDELVAAPGVDRERARRLRLLGTFARSASAPNSTTAALAADDTLPGAAARISDEVGFRSSLRWSGITLADPDAPGGAERATVVLGAPATLRPSLGDDAAVLDDLGRRARELAGQGLRVLLLATTPAGTEGSLRDGYVRPRLPPLQAVALVAMADELRDGVVDVLAGLAAEDVAVKVVSGDDPDTVAALARRAGLIGPAIAGPDLAALAPGTCTDAFDDAVAGHSVFGRIAPEQKEQIVGCLRRRGHQVAIVGDGVNAARALKRGPGRRRDALGQFGHPRRHRHRAARRLVRHAAAGPHRGPADHRRRRVVDVSVPRPRDDPDAGHPDRHAARARFPYTPTQVGLTLFTVGLPTLFLTMWAKPEVPQEDLLVSLARFVIPVGIITAGFGTAVYAILYRFISDALTVGGAAGPPGGLFESYTGLASSDPEFVTASATLGAQSGLSVFISLTALVLILLLEPPARIFASWNPVTTDRRPTLLAVGLTVAFAGVLLIPATRSYFGLTAPDPPVIYVAVPALLVWFAVISVVLRFRVLERMLGLLGGAPEPSTAPAPRR